VPFSSGFRFLRHLFPLLLHYDDGDGNHPPTGLWPVVPANVADDDFGIASIHHNRRLRPIVAAAAEVRPIVVVAVGAGPAGVIVVVAEQLVPVVVPKGGQQLNLAQWHHLRSMRPKQPRHCFVAGGGQVVVGQRPIVEGRQDWKPMRQFVGRQQSAVDGRHFVAVWKGGE
jgi:hypothetical protein